MRLYTGPPVQVREKWHAGIYWPETTLQGLTDDWLVTTSPYEAIKDMKDAARRKGHLIVEEVERELMFSLLNVSGFISCRPHEIPIIIDPTIITLNDAKFVKEAVWEIVKSEIEKRKKEMERRKNYPDDLIPLLPDIKSRAIPAEEPEALAPFLRCRQKTFENYLRWYDQWKRKLTFREITYIEMTHSNPTKKEEFFRKYAEKRKITVITSTMPDDLRLSITAKENVVRKGVDLIYFAIHREKRVSDNPPEEITETPPSSKPHKCTRDARTC